MLLDTLNPNNNFSFNISAAHILGLINAIYCAELLNIYNKAKKKKKINNESFRVDRKYIEERTTISVEDQYVCNSALSEIGILEVDLADPDIMKFNFEVYIKIITNDDCTFLNQVSKKLKVSKDGAAVKQMKKAAIVKNLEAYINTGNKELNIKLSNWLTVNYAANRVTKETVIDFQNILINYINGNIKKGLRIVDIAIAQKWINCIWAIEAYEKEEKVLSKSMQVSNINNIKIATKETLCKKVY